jgi:hypothetical protein
MSLQLIQTGDGKAAIGSDPVTSERGFLVKMNNKTGANSVKGSVVSASDATDNAFKLQDNELDAFGVVAEDGVADGSDCWVWMNGSACQVLWEDGEDATREYVALSSDVDGRGFDIAVPSSNPVQAQHFKEIGHTLESKGSGTDVLVLCMLHFN